MRSFSILSLFSFAASLLGTGLLGAGCWGAPAEGRFPCDDRSDCPTDWFCRTDDRCWSTPDGADAGLDGSVDASADAGTDAPLFDAGPPAACGDGVITDISLAPLVLGLLGEEVIGLPVVRWGPVPTPMDSDGPVFPALSLALGRSGVAVFGVIGFSDRRPVLTRLDVNDWLAPPADVNVGLDVPVRAFAVGPGVDTSSFVGLGLGTPAAAGELAGFGFTYRGTGTPTETPITASAPPHATQSQTTSVGGTRAVDGARATPWVIAHETVDGAHILGAVDVDSGFTTYRTTLLPGAVNGMHVTGSFSNLVLVQDPTTRAMRIWDVEASTDYVEGAVRTDQTLVLTTPTTPVGIAAIERPYIDPTAHVVAVPTSMGVALYSFSCPFTGCEVVSTPLSTVSVPGGAIPDQVDLVRIAQGFALTLVDVETGRIYLRFLDETLADVSPTLLDAPWVVVDAPFRIEFVATAATLTSTGSALVVAVLGRDGLAGSDEVRVAGYRSCMSD